MWPSKRHFFDSGADAFKSSGTGAMVGEEVASDCLGVVGVCVTC